MRNSLSLSLCCFDRGPVFLDDADHLPGFCIVRCAFFLRAGSGGDEKRPHLHAQVAAWRGAMGRGGGEGHLVFPACSGPEDLLEDFVQAIDQPGMGTKIGLQLQRCQLHRRRSFAQAVAPGAFKELYLGLAKHIDRLHGIADQEAAASAGGLPPAGNQGEAARTGCAMYPETRPPADEAIVRQHRRPIRSTRPRHRAKPAAQPDLARQSPPRHARRKPGAARRPHSAG